jgi:hypothetical protein
VVLGGTMWPKIENVGFGMMSVMTITLSIKEGKRMAETITVLVTKTKQSHLVPVGIGTEKSGI